LARRPLIVLLYQLRMIYDDECGAVGGMIIGRGSRSTRRKPSQVPLCPPQIPHDLTSNPGRRSGKPATNRLKSGTALRGVLLNVLGYLKLEPLINTTHSHSLTHGAEPFLRNCQLYSYSRNSQHFMEPEGSLPCS
jgi:hypothetical protein